METFEHNGPRIRLLAHLVVPSVSSSVVCARFCATTHHRPRICIAPFFFKLPETSRVPVAKGLDTVHRVVVGSLGLATLVLGTSALLNAGSALSWHWSKEKRASESGPSAPSRADASSSPE
ncbi:unnamed protein product [Closterium sp. Yama58-4]|nr:unnamed protein product [Closterium sp. Yama58-4]